jgi:hypothetical protein
MDSHLNMIELNGAVREFATYEDVLRYWFPVRKQFYEKRIARETVILQLKLQMLKNIKRYVSEYETLGIQRVDDATAEQILATRSPPYTRFNKSVVENPKYIPVDELRHRACEDDKCTYDYLLNTTDREKLTRAIERRDEEIAKLEYELKELTEKAQKGKFPGAQIWHEELDRLEKVIEEGRATDWLFGEKDKFKYPE